MATCFFCNTKEADTIFVQKLHKKVSEDFKFEGSGQIIKTTKHYAIRTVDIPVCKECKENKDLSEKNIGCGLLLGILIGIPFFLFGWKLNEMFIKLLPRTIGSIIVVIVCTLIFVMLMKAFGKKASKKYLMKEFSYPEVKQLVSEGWNLGTP